MLSKIESPVEQKAENAESAESAETKEIVDITLDESTNIDDIVIDKDKSTVTLRNGVSLDLGGVVKGYVSKIYNSYNSK